MTLRSKVLSWLVVFACSVLFSSGQSVDTGNCCLTVDTSLACAIGNFQYPKYAPSIMYSSSMLLGHSETYVVDCWAASSDWRWVVGWTGLLPPRYGSEQTLGSCVDDGNHPIPRGIRARRYFVGRGSRNWPAFDDLVILIYNYINPTDSTLRGLYAGVVGDFDLGTAPTTNIGRTDQSRRLTYMQPSWSSQNPTAGVRLLYPRIAANNSLVDHALYLYPPGEPSESTKMRFLNGTIRLPNSTRAYDYSIFVSAGPFDLPPRDSSTWVVYCLVGGSDSTTARIHSDSAQSWCDREVVGIREHPVLDLARAEKVGLRVLRNPTTVRRGVRLLVIGDREDARLQVFDVAGKLVRSFTSGPSPIASRPVTLHLSPGIYFVRLEAGSATVTKKVVVLE